MAENQRIEFVIKPDGTVEEKVTGISGPACDGVTRAIEDALGKVARRERTAEYYNKSEQQSGDTVTTNS
jgi:hypothetical protein